MGAYIVRRLLLMIPTLFGIMAISFAITQFAPGGPVEELIARMTGNSVAATARITDNRNETGLPGGSPKSVVTSTAGGPGGEQVSTSGYRGSRGLSEKYIAQIRAKFGFDRPPLERFGKMLWDYLRFDFGRSFFRDISVIDLIKEKLPVSITLGLWMTLLSYGISIPLGIAKAVRDGSRFDLWTSSIVLVGYALPGFLIGILLIVLFAGGSFWNIFPIKGLVSSNFDSLSWPQKILDYLWHITLPIIAMGLGAFATATFLTKNSFLDEIRKQYVVTARAKGLSEGRILYGHVFRNAMLIVIATFPAAFVSAFFTGSLLIETTFSLDGLGLLGLNSVINRDYPVVFATLYIFSLAGLFIALISDLTYAWVDPRIDFESRAV
ncbi:MAG: microcin ABC transporter permease [Devosia sp. 67-54]|uniref:microcin C ABC transporter permease YejB n=1 Tax=unclassified Devosia TaxID=196773 RepID=UPI00095F4F4D|nr:MULTISPECIES: microcin C ABC transporter permease YejB [unclassified Devosia]MBN9307614.1 microcin C ABC transporter permease YejB [Devosia sp.]OJX19964.1 MAG: microcin ABC transporter permease [Devosia sp. 67-54]